MFDFQLTSNINRKYFLSLFIRISLKISKKGNSRQSIFKRMGTIPKKNLDNLHSTYRSLQTMHIDLLCVKQLTSAQQFSFVTPCCLFVAFTDWIKVKRGCGCGRSHRNYGNVESLPFTKIHILRQA